MATYYWRGGTSTWGTGQNANWSVNGNPVYYGFYNPGAADDVVFDATSGTCTVTINGARSINNLTMTGFTGILTGTGQASIAINGSTCTLSASGTFDPSNYPALIFASSSCTLTSNGQTIGNITLQSGSLYLADNLQTNNNSTLILTAGTFNGNGNNVAVGYLTDNGSAASKTLNMGGGRWTLMADGPVAAIGSSAGPETALNILQPSSMALNTNGSLFYIRRPRYVTTLAATINNGATSITLRDTVTDNAGGSAWPTAGTITIYDYAISYTGKTGNTLTGVTGVTTTLSAGSQVFLMQPKTSTLSTAIPNGTDTSTITVADNTMFGNEGWIQIDDEVISYTAKSGATGFTGITRATAYGGSGKAHSVGAIVRPVEGVTLNTGGKSVQFWVSHVGHVQHATINGIAWAGGITSLGSIPGKIHINSNGTASYDVYVNPYIGSTYSTYSWTSVPSSINEGSTGTINYTGLGIPGGTTLNWTLSNSGDFPSPTGSFTASGNSIDGVSGSFSVTPSADVTTEGAESFYALISGYPSTNSVLHQTNNITINDTSVGTPTYTFSSYPSSINEGSAGTFNVTTTNVANGTTLYWTINLMTSSSGEYSATSGSFTINNNTGSFTVTPVADSWTEGAEYFTVTVWTGSTSGTPVVTTGIVYINDTSTRPISGSFTSITPGSIDEGGTPTAITINVQGVSSGTNVYWNVSSTLAGFNPTTDINPSSGIVSVSGGDINNGRTGTFYIYGTWDDVYEGTESFYVTIALGNYYGSPGASYLASSSIITLVDKTPNYTFSGVPSSVNEGSSFQIGFNVNNVVPQSYNWYIDRQRTTFSNNASYTPNGSTGVTYIGFDDDNEFAVSLPFNVYFYDTNGILVAYNLIYVGTNGYIAFGNSASSVIGIPYNIGTPHLKFFSADRLTTAYTRNLGDGRFIVYLDGSDYADNSDYWNAEICFYQNQSYYDFYSTLVPYAGETILAAGDGLRPYSAYTPVVQGYKHRITVSSQNEIGDFSAYSGTITTTGTFASNSAYLPSVTVNADNLTEGAEYFRVVMQNPTNLGYLEKAATSQITINDTSISVTATFTGIGLYSYLGVPNTQDENSWISSFTVTTTGVNTGTTLYWTLDYITASGADLGITSGSFVTSGTYTSGSGSVSNPTYTLADYVTEGSETFRFQIRTGSTSGPVIGTSQIITINDTTTADRYWVGSGTWGNNSGNWSYYSGGPADAPPPGSNNNVYFDANSGNCNVAASRSCLNLTTTGYTNTLSGAGNSAIYVYGNVTLGNTGIFSTAGSTPPLYFVGAYSQSLTTNGQTVGNIILNNTQLILADDLITQNNAGITFITGLFNTNNKNITVGYFYSNQVAARALYFGTGKWTLMGVSEYTGTFVDWDVTTASSTLGAVGTPNIRLLRARVTAGLKAPIVGSIYLVDTTGWPTSGTVLIDDEEISYTGISGTTLTGITRGVNGTTQAYHNTGSAVLHIGPTTTTLSGTINPGATSLTVADATVIYSGNTGQLWIEDELITWTSKVGNTFTVSGVTKTHNAGVKVAAAESRTINSSNLTYGTLELRSNGNYQLTKITGSGNTFANITNNSKGKQEVQFEAGSTTYFTNFSLSGNSTERILLRSTSTTNAILQKPGSGVSNYWYIGNNSKLGTSCIGLINGTSGGSTLDYLDAAYITANPYGADYGDDGGFFI